jgi:hypothetical protein
MPKVPKMPKMPKVEEQRQEQRKAKQHGSTAFLNYFFLPMEVKIAKSSLHSL